jgi:hypothetical protein
MITAEECRDMAERLRQEAGYAPPLVSAELEDLAILYGDLAELLEAGLAKPVAGDN